MNKHKEYVRYLTNHEYITMTIYGRAMSKTYKQLNENLRQIHLLNEKIANKRPGDGECYLYNAQMLKILGVERRMLKETRDKISRNMDFIVKRAQRRMCDIRLLNCDD